MMRVEVDISVCIGSGMCTTIAPTVFELDAGKVVTLLKAEIEDGDEAELVADAIACCPVEAIKGRDI